MDASTDAQDLVDPRAPRFGQGITATFMLAGVLLQAPTLVAVIAVVLGVSAVSGWRLDLYSYLWRHVALRVVGPSREREAAAPHRFSKLLGAAGSVLAAVLLWAEFVLVGYALAFAVGVLAAVAATTGFCLGCRLYGQMAFLRRRDVV